MQKLLYYSIYLIFLATPLESVEVGNEISLVKIFAILVIILGLWNFKTLLLKKSLFLLIIAPYVVIALLSTIWSYDYLITAKTVVFTIVPSYIITIIIYSSINNKTQLYNLFISYIVGCSIIAVVSMHSVFIGKVSYNEDRLTVLGQDQNELSFLLSFGIVSIIYILKYYKMNRVFEITLAIIGIIFAFNILLTGSRTGFIILLTIAAVLLIMNVNKVRIVIMLPLIIILLLIFFNNIPEAIGVRLFQTDEQIRNGDLTGRMKIWQRGLYFFEMQGSLFWGMGYNTFSTMMKNSVGHAYAPHNTFISTFIELGIIGLTSYIAILGFLIYKVIYLIKHESIFFLLLILPLLLAMTTLGTENRRWLFLIGILIMKNWQYCRHKITRKIMAYEYTNITIDN